MTSRRTRPAVHAARTAAIAATSVAALAVAVPGAATAASAVPVVRMTFPAAGEVLPCGSSTYTFTSGTLTLVTKSTDPSDIPAAHVVLGHVVATGQDGLEYRVQGSETYNDAMGLLILKIQFISPTGLVDNVNVVLENIDAGGHGFTFGSCTYP